LDLVDVVSVTREMDILNGFRIH
jgi:hypothetical protein